MRYGGSLTWRQKWQAMIPVKNRNLNLIVCVISLCPEHMCLQQLTDDGIVDEEIDSEFSSSWYLRWNSLDKEKEEEFSNFLRHIMTRATGSGTATAAYNDDIHDNAAISGIFRSPTDVDFPLWRICCRVRLLITISEQSYNDVNLVWIRGRCCILSFAEGFIQARNPSRFHKRLVPWLDISRSNHE